MQKRMRKIPTGILSDSAIAIRFGNCERRFFLSSLLLFVASCNGHIIDESVIAFVLVPKSGKFRHATGKASTLVTWYWLVMAAPLLHAPIRVWGIVYL